MIENPHDLLIIRIALQLGIEEHERNRHGNPRFVEEARHTLSKVERLIAAWHERQARREARHEGAG